MYDTTANIGDFKLEQATITEEELKSLHELIHKLTEHIEGVLSHDISTLEVDFPSIHQTLIDLQDMWEGGDIQAAYETWSEMDH